MFFVYFGIWLLLNGRVSPDVLITGAFCSALVYVFTWKIIGLTPRRELMTIRHAGAYLHYFACLFVEILKANAQVIRIILNFDEEPEPQLVTVKSGLNDPASRVLLSNSITLTPGTITVHNAEGTLLVHALDASMAEGMDESGLVHELRDIEGAE